MPGRTISRGKSVGLGPQIHRHLLGTTAIALLLVTISLFVLEYQQGRAALVQQVDAVAQMIAANAGPAVTLDDRDGALRILQTLELQKDIRSAKILLPNGDYFVGTYWNKKGMPTGVDRQWRQNAMRDTNSRLAHRFDADDLDVLVTILVQGTRVGYLHIEAELRPLHQQARTYAVIAAALFVLLIGGVNLASHRLQRRILGPIHQLTKGIHKVSETQDYSLRLAAESGDEVGELISGFNEMLEQLEARDRAIVGNRRNLERQVAERTADLAEAKDSAETASRAKSDFLATMSHEIRTPMNGVLGMTEMLLGSGLTPRQKRLAETAFRSAQGLLGLIDNVLDFSKIEANRLELSPQETELRPLLDDTLEMLAAQAHSKGIELIADLPPDLPRQVRCDATRLRQILINLLGNAVKFTERGEVRLRVRALDHTEGSVTLDIQVSDSGPGIPKAQQRDIFAPFVQADSSATRRFNGTGLGLAISHRLAQLMGGEIRLDSEVGRGSTFQLSLRMQVVEATGHAPAPEHAIAGVRLLIVDDHATSSEVLHSQIAAWGLRDDRATGAAEAVALLRKAAAAQDPYRIALLDWQMPDLDGLALARQIKSDPLIPAPVLIMLSAADDDAIALQDPDAGISYYLPKPVRQDRLLTCLLDAQRERMPCTTLAAPTAEQPEFRDVHVLLAEDNLANQEVALDMLELLGCQVDVVRNGSEAIQAFGRQTYQLILMDCHMPVTDGFQAAAAIRGLEREQQRQRIPIVALTADVQQGIEQQCRNAGMDEYLSKPFDQRRLAQALRRWLPGEGTSTGAGTKTWPFPASSTALDAAVIQQLRQLGQSSGKDLLAKLAALFCNEAPNLLTAMRDGIAQGNKPAVQRAAHALKSASAQLGATGLAERCAELEAAVGDDGNGQLDELFSALGTAADEAVSAIGQLMTPSTPAAGAQPGRQITNSKRVLVVDDDAGFRLTTREALRAQGFATDEAADGEQALFRVERRPPDLILIDAVIHGMDGFEICRRLREHASSKDTPIVIVTALEDVSAMERAFQAGATDFVSKPVSYPALVQRIHFMLRSSENEAQLRDHKAMLLTAQRVARLGYWRWEHANGEFQISDNLCEMCGITPGDCGGTLDAFLSLVCSEDRERVAGHLRAAMHDHQLGAFDYCMTGPNGESMIVRQDLEFIPTTGGLSLLGTVQDVTRQRDSEDQIRKMAYYDALTGLASRSHLMQHLEDLIRVAQRRNEQFSMLFLDLDGFKDVNDSLGHDVGDFMLVSIARRLQGVIRDVDFVARLGGDEFCILLDDSRDELDAAEVASRCLETINQPIEFASQTWRPHVSIGLARFPEDGNSAGMLLKAADSAMYAAKQSGKHRYAFYRPEMTEEAEQRLASEQMLREAIEQEQFELHYQPQIDLHSGEMIGVEALARWRHPQRGVVMPGEFVPTLERIGLISDLGNWVIRTACNQAVAWLRAGLPPIRVAVNISPLHFHDAEIMRSVSDALDTSGLSPQQLEIEITESSVQSDSRALLVLRELQSLGVRISIDDFGTGYSSLGSLKHLPINTLKVDRVFVADMLNNNEDAVLLGTIIGLSHALGYTVLAEGVEERDQAAVLAGLNCDLAQGYYFSRPLSADRIPALIRRGSFVSAQPAPPALLNAVVGGQDA